MKNLTFEQWAIAMIVLLLFGWLGSITEVYALNAIAAFGLSFLVVERIVEQVRRRNRTR